MNPGSPTSNNRSGGSTYLDRRLNERIERDLQQPAGMPHAYYLILAMLSEAPGRSLRMNQLAVVVEASQSRVSHAVARLEEQGWVRRERSPGDRRGQIAELTDAGWARVRGGSGARGDGALHHVRRPGRPRPRRAEPPVRQDRAESRSVGNGLRLSVAGGFVRWRGEPVE